MPSGANTPAGEPSPSAEDAPILGLERFAAMSADIESGAARDEVIGREGLSIEAWTRAQESWLGKMADEASRKRFELTNRYNSAFVAQRRSEGGARRVGKKKGARVEPASPAAAPAPVPAVPSFVAAAPAFVAPPPSFVAPPSFIASPPPFVEEPTPFAAPTPSFARALPFAPPSPVAMPAIVAPIPTPIHAAPPAVAAMPTNLAGTVAAEMISPFASGAPLPFNQGRSLPSAPPPPAAKPPPRALGSSTVSGIISPFATSATPFAASAESRSPPSSSTPSLASIQALPRPAFDPDAPMDLGGTVVASSRDPHADGGKLPFRASNEAAARLPPPAPSPPRPPGIGLPFRASPPPLPAPAAPPAPAAAPRATRFSLEQFASLSAEIAVTPAAVAQVRGRYGLDDASHRAEAEEWGRRFSADKELFARYGALFQSYRDWLARSPR